MVRLLLPPIPTLILPDASYRCRICCNVCRVVRHVATRCMPATDRNKVTRSMNCSFPVDSTKLIARSPVRCICVAVCDLRRSAPVEGDIGAILSGDQVQSRLSFGIPLVMATGKSFRRGS